MKNLKFIIMTFFSIGFSALWLSCGHLIPLKGNGDIISSERTLSSFDKIHSSGSAAIRYHASEEYRVVITSDANLVEYVETNIKNTILNIAPKKGKSYSFTELTVDVYCPSISGISMSGSGYFKGMDTIMTTQFESHISGSGTIEGAIECNDFSANISGSGTITVTGNSNTANVDISGSGNYNGRDFKVNNGNVHVTGSGKMHVWVSELLNVSISGSGKVTYRGNPKIEYSGSGSGRLISE